MSDTAAAQDDLGVSETEEGDSTMVAKMASTASVSHDLKQRLRLLKQKMNQAQHLNQLAVHEEAERAGGQLQKNHKDGKISGGKKNQGQVRIHQERHAKAYEAAANEVDAKYLTEQAYESVAKAQARTEKQEIQQFSVNDYYNPEGQHRNYLRNLKSLPQHANPQMASQPAALVKDLDENQSGEVFASLMQPQGMTDQAREKAGVKRLANELHRRIENKQRKEQKRKDKEESREEGTVTYINQRNKRFNEKINRAYDKDTAEIRQNLERGTAL